MSGGVSCSVCILMEDFPVSGGDNIVNLLEESDSLFGGRCISTWDNGEIFLNDVVMSRDDGVNPTEKLICVPGITA